MTVEDLYVNAEKNTPTKVLLLNTHIIKSICPAMWWKWSSNIKTAYGWSLEERRVLCEHIGEKMMREAWSISVVVDCAQLWDNPEESIKNMVLQACSWLVKLNEWEFPLATRADTYKNSTWSLWFLLKEMQWKYGNNKFSFIFHNADRLMSVRNWWVVDALVWLSNSETPRNVRNDEAEDDGEFVFWEWELIFGCLFSCANESFYKIADLSKKIHRILNSIYSVKSTADDIAQTIAG